MANVDAPTVENPMVLTREQLKYLPFGERYAVLMELKKKSGLVRLVEEAS